MNRATAIKLALKTFEDCIRSKNTHRYRDTRRRLIDMYTSQTRKFADLNGIIAELRKEVRSLNERLAKFEEDW